MWPNALVVRLTFTMQPYTYVRVRSPFLTKRMIYHRRGGRDQNNWPGNPPNLFMRVERPTDRPSKI